MALITIMPIWQSLSSYPSYSSYHHNRQRRHSHHNHRSYRIQHTQSSQPSSSSSRHTRLRHLYCRRPWSRWEWAAPSSCSVGSPSTLPSCAASFVWWRSHWPIRSRYQLFRSPDWRACLTARPYWAAMTRRFCSSSWSPTLSPSSLSVSPSAPASQKVNTKTTSIIEWTHFSYGAGYYYSRIVAGFTQYRMTRLLICWWIHRLLLSDVFSGGSFVKYCLNLTCTVYVGELVASKRGMQINRGFSLDVFRGKYE